MMTRDLKTAVPRGSNLSDGELAEVWAKVQGYLEEVGV